MILSTPWSWATLRLRSQYKNGATCGVIPDVVDLEERNAQAFNGYSKGVSRRGTTRDIGVIDVFDVQNVSDIGVTGGIKGPGGSAMRVG